MASRVGLGRFVNSLLSVIAMSVAVFPAAALASQQSSSAAHPVAIHRPFSHDWSSQQVSADLGKLPMAFEPNRGQIPGGYSFMAREGLNTVFLGRSGIVIEMRVLKNAAAVKRSRLKPQAKVMALNGVGQVAPKFRETSIRLRFLGADRSAKLAGLERLPGKVNYFISNKPSRWRRDIPTFAQVTYLDVYPGVDLLAYSRDGHFEYDWDIHPGADTNRIRVAVNGAKSVSVGANGKTSIRTALGKLTEPSPTAYQVRSGQATGNVSVEQVLVGSRTLALRIGRFNRNEPLVVDPQIIYSTYFGDGTDACCDDVTSVRVDASDDAYVGLDTYSPNLPVISGAGDANTSTGYSVGYIGEIAPSGSSLLFSTYLSGTTQGSYIENLAMDPSGNLVAVGVADSSDFPVVNPLQTEPYGGFILKLSGSGDNILFSTYWSTLVIGVSTDSSGGIFVTGEDRLGNLLLANAFQSSRIPASPEGVPFISEVNAQGTAVLFSTYFGGSGATDTVRNRPLNDIGLSIAVSSDSILVAGITYSNDFPTKNAYLPAYTGGTTIYAGPEAWVARFSLSYQLEYSTYFGGTGGTELWLAATDSSDDAYLEGDTCSTNYPIVKPIQSAPAGTKCGTNGSTSPDYQGVVTKLNSTGQPVYSTYLGGSSTSGLQSGFVDNSGIFWVSGYTTAANFPGLTSSETPSSNGSCVVAALAPSGTSLISSFLYGGTGGDSCSLAFDSSGKSLFLFGSTCSQDFPVLNPVAGMNPPNVNNCTGFVARILFGSVTPAINVTAADGSQAGTADVSWAPPQSTGFGITSFTVSCQPSCTPVTVGPSAGLATIKGLTQGQTYKFTVSDSDVTGSTGTSAFSNTVVASALPNGTPPSPPNPPTNVVATGANQSISVSWTPPPQIDPSTGKSDWGQRAITSYALSCTPSCGSQSVWAGNTSTKINGLVNGKAYVVQVASVNLVGPSSHPASSNGVTPATTPDPPSDLYALPGYNGTATLSWAVPDNNGGAPVLSYTVSCVPDCSSADGLAPSVNSTEITGLNDGTSYTFTVVATNRMGPSASSPASDAVTPSLPAVSLSMSLSNYGPTSPGTSETITLTALDTNGSPATAYLGSVSWSSTDPGAVLPNSYSFGPQDLGTQDFPATLWAPGNNTVTATDSADSFTIISQPVVTAIPISQGFDLVALPTGALPTASSVATALNYPDALGAGAIDQVDLSDGNGGWNTFVPAQSPDLSIDPTQAVVVDSATDGFWVPSGTLYTAPLPVSLSMGWNLVAAPYPYSGQMASQIGAQTNNCGVDEVATWVGDTYQTWVPDQITDFNIPAYQGMWIYCESAATWTPGVGSQAQVQQGADSVKGHAARPLTLSSHVRRQSATGVITNQQLVDLHTNAAGVAWDTTGTTSGSVLYGLSCGHADSGLTQSNSNDVENGSEQRVELTGLAPSTTYYYAISSAGTIDDNGGHCYTFQTLESSDLSPLPLVAVGSVMAGASCSTPVADGIVTATDSTAGSTANSSSIGTSASTAPGAYSIAFSPETAPNSSGYIEPNAGDIITISADTAQGSATQQFTWDGTTKVVSIPNLCITSGSPSSLTVGGGTQSPPLYGDAVTFTASISASPTASSGNVAFYDGDPTAGGHLLSRARVSNGSAIAQITSLSAGAHSVFAVYSGNSALLPSVSANSVSQNISVAPLLVRAEDIPLTYGQTVPAVSPIYSVLKNGDTTILNPSTCLVSGHAPGSVLPVGTYTTTCSGGSDPNYKLNYKSGTLTVSPAPLTITASSPTITYGHGVPVIAPQYSGLENGEVQTHTAPTCSVTGHSLAQSIAAGSYPTTCAGAADGNYAITYVGGTITVNQAPLTITALNQSGVVASPLPPLTWTANFVSGDTAAALTQQPKCVTTATASSGVTSSPAGVYPITCSSAADSNYVISYGVAKLTVSAAKTTFTGLQPATARHGKRVAVRAQLATVGAAQPVAGRQVIFTMGSGATLQSCSARTNSAGVGTCNIPGLLAKKGKTNMTVTFAGDAAGGSLYYNSTKAAVKVTVT